MFWLNKQSTKTASSHCIQRLIHTHANTHIEHPIDIISAVSPYNHMHSGPLAHTLSFLFPAITYTWCVCFCLVFVENVMFSRICKPFHNGCGFHTKNIIATYIMVAATFLILSSNLNTSTHTHTYTVSVSCRWYDVVQLAFDGDHFTKRYAHRCEFIFKRS